MHTYVPSTIATGLLDPCSRPDRSPRSASGSTRPPPTVLELPGVMQGMGDMEMEIVMLAFVVGAGRGKERNERGGELEGKGRVSKRKKICMCTCVCV